MKRKQKGLPKFFEALKLSIVLSARQYFVLLGVLFIIFLYALRDSIVPIAVLLIFGSGAVNVPGAWSAILAVLMLFVLLFILIRFNGAMGYALTGIATGEKNWFELGQDSYERGFAFFVNALHTGVLLIFGQMLLVCPCFLLLTNFVFSPYLLVYEGLEGRSARERSGELASINPWLVFAQTAYLILIGYVLLLFAVILLFVNFGVISIAVFVLLALFLGLVQSNFIFKLYVELLSQSAETKGPKITPQFKIFVIASIAAVVLVYLGFRFFPAVM